MNWERLDWECHALVELLRNIVAHATKYRPPRFVTVQPNFIWTDAPDGGMVLDPRLRWIWPMPVRDGERLTFLGSLTLDERVSLFEGWEPDHMPIFTGDTADANPTPWPGLFHAPPFTSFFPHRVLAHLYSDQEGRRFGALVAR